MLKIWRFTLPLLALTLAACGSSHQPTTPGSSSSDPVAQASAPEAAQPVELAPGLSAYIKSQPLGCYVTNNTSSNVDISFRAYRVLDESDPSNVSKQQLVQGVVGLVPAGAQDFWVRWFNKPELCNGHYQLDCGRLPGLLAYKHIWVSGKPCTEPSPSPSPTPPPPPSCTTCECNPQLCPPPPPPTLLGYCHVSNKGKDGNVNLVVTFKQDGKGHDLHSTDPKYCPHDMAVYTPAVQYDKKPQPPQFECKLEGKNTEDFCSCEPFLEEAKTCSSINTEE